MKELALAIELSELFEHTETEGGLVAQLIDAEIMPFIRTGLYEADPIGLGDRFNRVIDKVRQSADRTGKDRIRTLKDMLKSALATYVQRTHDAMTARGVYHRSIMSGSDIMLAAAAAAILANALSGQHPKEAQTLMQKIASRLSGKQDPVPAMENASGAAVGAGAIAVLPCGKSKKKRRPKDSIFAEGDVIPFPGRLKPNSQNLYARMAQQLNPFSEARALAVKSGWNQDGHQQIPDTKFVASIHRDPSGSGFPLWIISNGSWHHMGSRGGFDSLPAYLEQHTMKIGEGTIREGDVIAFPGAQRPVDNPEISQADDVSNLYMLRPQAKRMANKFFVILFTPHDGEQEEYADLAEIKNAARYFNLTKYDRSNHMFYAPGDSAANVATLHVYHQDKTELSPVEAARINMEVQQYLQSASMRETVDWDDLVGNPTAMEVLREVANSGTLRRHDGVLVDPTTAELVLCVHGSLTPENRQRYEQKPLARMIAIAERAVQRGIIHVALEEDNPTNSVIRANTHDHSERSRINFEISRIKRLRQSARWKAEKLKPHYAALAKLDSADEI